MPIISIPSNSKCSFQLLPSPVLISCNVRSLRPKISTLGEVIPSDCCAIAVQETWLASDVDNAVVEIPGFMLFRADRDHSTKKHGGGVALYVRKDWCRHATVLEKICTDDMDMIAIDCDRFVLISLYVNIRRQDRVILDELCRIVEKYVHHKIIYLAGDVNRLSFQRVSLNALLKNIVPFSTRGEKGFLDQIWTNDPNSLKVHRLAKLSDHSGVLSEPLSKNRYKLSRDLVKHRFKVVDEDKLKTEFECTDWELLTSETNSVDELNSVVSTYIKFCYDSSCSYETITETNGLFSNRAIKHARRKRENSYKRGLDAEFRYWDNFCKEETKRVTSIALKRLRGCSNKAGQYWNELKRLANYKQVGKSTIPFNLNELNSFFLRFERVPEDLANVKSDISVEQTLLSITQVESLLRKNKNKVSSGYDGIPSQVLKKCASVLAPGVTSLFNMCLKNGILPSEWKRIIVTPVPKTTTIPKEKKDLRPAGCASALCRTFEHHLLQELQRYMPESESHQFGFRSKRSTSDAVLVFLDRVIGGLDKERTTIVRTLFLDFTSAFNTVSRKNILSRVSESSPEWMVEILRSYFTGVTQCVKFGRQVSEYKDCNTGVLQGGVLSPYLFNLAVSSLNLAESNSALIKYADDNTLTHEMSSIDHLNEYKGRIREIEEWATENHLLLNGSKTKELIFVQPGISSPDILKLMNERITVAGHDIEPVEKVKFLGIVIDSHLSFEPQLEEVLSKCIRVLNYAVKLLRNSGSGQAVEDFINACVLSMLMYGLPTYATFLSLELKRQIKSVLRRASYLMGKRPEDIISKFSAQLDGMSWKLVQKIRSDETHPLNDKISIVHRVTGPRTRSQAIVLPRVRTALAQKSLIYRSQLSESLGIF